MQKKNIIAVIALAFIIVLSGISAAVAAVTRPISFAQKKTVITSVTGTVEVKAPGATDWSPATAGTEVVPGTMLRTDASSGAEINFFDQGTARLDAETVVTLEEMKWDAANPTTFVGGLVLENGRVWSKLLDFLSPESSYQVRTATAVATVRGTAFDMRRIRQADGKILEGIFVKDHRVEATMTKPDGSKENVMVEKDERARMLWSGDKVETMVKGAAELTDDDKTWIEANGKADATFEAEVERRALEEARQARAIDPDSALIGLVPLAEKLRLALAGSDEKEKLRDQFSAGHLVDAFIASGSGDEAKAKTMMTWADALKGGDDQRDEPTAGKAAEMFGHRRKGVSEETRSMMEKAAPEQAEKLRRLMDRRKEFGDVSTEVEAADETQDDNTESNDSSDADDRKKNPALEPVTPTGDDTRTETGDKETDADETELQRAIEETRAADIKEQAELDESTRRQELEEREAQAELDRLNWGGDVPRPVGLGISGKVNLLPGESTALQAILKMSNGTQVDVSAKARWSASNDDLTGQSVGVMDGNVFRSNRTGGKSVVTASYSTEDGVMLATTTITAFSLELP